MASTIAAITTGTGGIVQTADASGNLSLLSGATTVVAVTSTGVAVTGTLSSSGAVTASTTLAVTGASTFTGTGKFATTIGVGNATPAASGSGITFPASQSASSDANTLDDYEEGTWTPVQGGGLTVVGAFSSSGRYTKIGRSVSISGRINGATSIATTAGTIMMTGLPFTVLEAAAIGTFSNSNLNALAGLGAFTTTAYSTTTMGTTLTFDFSCTYTVA